MDRFQTIRRLVRHGTLPQLAAFEAIVRLGSYTRAAERLHMAQPTISGHMRKLTEAAGQPLLVIEGRQVRPTPAGQALLAATQEIFAALERAEGVLRGAAAPCHLQIPDPHPARSTAAG
jgi:DNA-binding transcriptional LysR family regulator